MERKGKGMNWTESSSHWGFFAFSNQWLESFTSLNQRHITSRAQCCRSSYNFQRTNPLIWNFNGYIVNSEILSGSTGITSSPTQKSHYDAFNGMSLYEAFLLHSAKNIFLIKYFFSYCKCISFKSAQFDFVQPECRVTTCFSVTSIWKACNFRWLVSVFTVSLE